MKRSSPIVLACDGVASDYTVMCCHGTRTEEHGPHLLLDVRERITLDTPVDGLDHEWRDSILPGTPAFLAQHLANGRGTFICTGCKTGDREIASAFLDAGHSAYIGCQHTIDSNSGTLFVLDFFHHLLAEERDLPTTTYDEQQAVARARLIDSDEIRCGTTGFRYFARELGAASQRVRTDHLTARGGSRASLKTPPLARSKTRFGRPRIFFHHGLLRR